ncbi:ribbon-helix-helix domain-containing protein [Hafnia psychrotolerans]|uniref:Uncharacterized protein n=1 Tax=Hafnia psychrotolerans TaxID=1477018 RepID=A0ABQ1H894_9GAMM|nr:hypothetical protein [Hafnia psychrotolerans]GGA62912.1 hypothetical protein GCM10011328_42590 [Hafnia psychrotolerans]
MSNFDDFEDGDQEQQGANVAVKFTFPGGLARSLNLYAQSTSRSKTEIVKEAIEQRLRSDPAWLAGLFFFEKNGEKDEKRFLEALHQAPRGTLIKVAALNKDAPDSANILICNFIRARDRLISFEIPTNFRPTLLSESRYTDLTSVKLVSGQMVLPHEDQNVGALGMTRRWVYTIDIKYIWDVDCQPPQFLL